MPNVFKDLNQLLAWYRVRHADQYDVAFRQWLETEYVPIAGGWEY
jgi:hypothetical protein